MLSCKSGGDDIRYEDDSIYDIVYSGSRAYLELFGCLRAAKSTYLMIIMQLIIVFYTTHPHYAAASKD